MLRGFNAISLQAHHIPSKDAADFLFFVGAWCEWILDHHKLEETILFPGFANVEGVSKGALEENVEQHHAFSSGLQDLSDYARNTAAEDYDSKELMALIDAFASPLRAHLISEPITLMSLDCVPAEHAHELLAVYKKCEAEAGKQDKFVVPPMVLGLCDKTFQGGNDWPQLPWGSEYIVKWVLARRHAGAWRFLPSDGWRMPRPLAFLGNEQ